MVFDRKEFERLADRAERADNPVLKQKAIAQMEKMLSAYKDGLSGVLQKTEKKFNTFDTLSTKLDASVDALLGGNIGAVEEADVSALIREAQQRGRDDLLRTFPEVPVGIKNNYLPQEKSNTSLKSPVIEKQPDKKIYDISVAEEEALFDLLEGESDPKQSLPESKGNSSSDVSDQEFEDWISELEREEASSDVSDEELDDWLGSLEENVTSAQQPVQSSRVQPVVKEIQNKTTPPVTQANQSKIDKYNTVSAKTKEMKTQFTDLRDGFLERQQARKDEMHRKYPNHKAHKP